MFRFLVLCFGTLVGLFCSRQSLLLENLALRQQLSALREIGSGPRLLLIVKPATVIAWYRKAFRLHKPQRTCVSEGNFR